ncbi:LOB domain-containing protein 15 [Acorus calamus]|uniref:LOB domain-containing protein 15 n=1 Tax=Acorus calamus TaxID=4465 RepID=A0AAV9CCL8_ACOCL|nr:LOB domain-containing protein 15 [Acorus calamus]
MCMKRERSLDEIGKKIKRESDAAASSADRMGRRHMMGPPGTLNTVTPCAACKLLRRRCAQECPFSPYFSPHEPHKFASVHKVFGASNVSKLLMEVPENQRADAANSLVYETNVRLRDPVYGCMGVISALQQQIQSLEAELGLVRSEILRHQYREGGGGGGASNIVVPTSQAAVALLASGTVSVAAVGVPPPPIPPPHHHHQQQQQQQTSIQIASASSMYGLMPPSTAASSTDYSSISNDNVSFFG